MPDLKVVDLGNLVADTSTPGVQVLGSWKTPTGQVNIRSTGDFNGGTLTYEGSKDNAEWYSLGANAALLAPGGAELSVLEGEYIRATLVGAGADIDTCVLIPGTTRNQL